MTAKHIFVLAACLWAALLSAEPAFAQQAGANPYTDLSEYLLVGNQPVPQQALSVTSTNNLTSVVHQIGQNNYANAELSGVGDMTTQIQNGTGNSSNISVNGTDNNIQTTQIGRSNTVAIGVNGNGNSISNLQVGSGLSYGIHVTGTGQPISVQQYGVK